MSAGCGTAWRTSANRYEFFALAEQKLRAGRQIRTDSIVCVHAEELVRIGPEDWREFRAVRLASLNDAPDAFGSRHADWIDAAEHRWRARLTDVPFTVVARGAEGPVGVVSGVESGQAVELISMWVAPSQRGTGLSGRLMDEVIAWATARGQQTCLMVRGDNVVAIRAYTRAGFVDHGVPEDWPAGAPPERRMWHGLADTSPEASPHDAVDRR